MSFLKVPPNLTLYVEAHRKWLRIFKEAQRIVADDVDLQEKAQKGLWLKERYLPPEVIGRVYAQYCNLINKMYDAYLYNTHLQRASYMLELITVMVKRMYELRNELAFIIVNDYIYVDAALLQLRMIPPDIQIDVPYHFPIELRDKTLEEMLEKMFVDALKRKIVLQKKEQPRAKRKVLVESDENVVANKIDSDDDGSLDQEQSEHVVITEEFIQANIIQKHERFRQYFIADYKSKCKQRKMYALVKVESASLDQKIRAATYIQQVYRKYMKIKRDHILQTKKDILLGLIPNPENNSMSLEEEKKKIFERRSKLRQKIQAKAYSKDFENEKHRLITYKKEDQIDDIIVHIREWFREWLYGYGFFPQYPYEAEGGTIMVIRGDYPTVEEKQIEDEKLAATTKGKTKEQLKQERDQAKKDAKLKAEAEKDRQKRDAEALFKMRCNPFSDPGYQLNTSEVSEAIVEALQNYVSTWSIYDNTEDSTDAIFGYIKNLITEDIMSQIHQDCRVYVDELMRLELKLLVKVHEMMYKNLGWKYPKFPPRKKPKPIAVPKRLNVDDDMLKEFEEIFDLGIVTRPSSKIKDIYGDSNFAAYELNIKDPDASFPLPGYGDIRRRLILSCVFGAGTEPGPKRNKSVMLLGQERNGKSFLVDCVCGEINAIKIDITPEVFSAVLDKPGKVLNKVFLAAKALQPAVIFMKNIERVFAKKVPPQDKYLNAKSVKTALLKSIKLIANNDKVIFIGTCTYPLTAQEKPLTSMFNEILLVPRTDYGSLQQFYYTKLQSINSMERDYCVKSLAVTMRGYGFGRIIENYNNVMSAERICRLNLEPLLPNEFLYPLMEDEVEQLTLEDYQLYIDFFISNSPLSKTREEYSVINRYRKVAYEKLSKESKKK